MKVYQGALLVLKLIRQVEQQQLTRMGKCLSYNLCFPRPSARSSHLCFPKKSQLESMLLRMAGSAYCCLVLSSPSTLY